MRCDYCPLFESWNNESGSGANCAIFGDDWGNRFQYEDKHGTVIGCYIEKAYINRVEREIEKAHESYVKAFLEEEKKRNDEVVIPTWEPPEVRHDPV